MLLGVDEVGDLREDGFIVNRLIEERRFIRGSSRGAFGDPVNSPKDCSIRFVGRGGAGIREQMGCTRVEIHAYTLKD